MRLKAQAKVNLGLRVVAKRPDGFHELDTLFARLALHDEIELEPAEGGISLKVSGADLPEDASNLAYRAAAVYLQASGKPGAITIKLHKNIPVAAGLGGGSSDAAAVLRGLSELYPAQVDLERLALELGSDVPFFLSNYTAARGRGRGERLAPVALPRLSIVLVNPGIAISAGAAYGALATLGEALELPDILEALYEGKAPPYTNDLQAGVLGLEPVIGEVLDALERAGLRGVLMSGSGSTCFGIADGRARAEEIAKALRQQRPDWWVCGAETLTGR